MKTHIQSINWARASFSKGEWFCSLVQSLSSCDGFKTTFQNAIFFKEKRAACSLTNRASGFYMKGDILFLFQGKEYSVKAPSGVHAFAYEN